MTEKKFFDPYAELLDRFNRNGVAYVVVGMTGINYYASEASEIFSTQDFDIFLKPTIANVEKALRVFRAMKYHCGAGNKDIKDIAVKDIVKNKNTITANDPYGITFELILAVSGYSFSQMHKDASVFSINNVPIKVGRLSKLLKSKKIAGRDKDKFFLQRYELMLKEKHKNER